MGWFGSAVDVVRALPPGEEAQVAGAMALVACVLLAGVPWGRAWRLVGRGPRGLDPLTGGPLLRLHRPDLPWKLEKPGGREAG